MPNFKPKQVIMQQLSNSFSYFVIWWQHFFNNNINNNLYVTSTWRHSKAVAGGTLIHS